MSVHHDHAPSYFNIDESTIKDDTDSNMVGTATLIERESSNGVKLVGIKMEEKGLKGKHTVRVHERANWTPSKFKMRVSFKVEERRWCLLTVSIRRQSDRCVCTTLMQKYVS
ncbi:MAG: hypothetical protein KC594_15540 [Nitrospira sp.]|nr:hypothetical protein [Nitrospira sp.]